MEYWEDDKRVKPTVLVMGEAGAKVRMNALRPDDAVAADLACDGLDFVYVGGETADRLFAAFRRLQGPGGTEIPVPKPEHLAALKVLAMKNDPGRTFQEMADIRFLLTLSGVDRGEVRGYFERHGLKDRFDELESTL